MLDGNLCFHRGEENKLLWRMIYKHNMGRRLLHSYFMQWTEKNSTDAKSERAAQPDNTEEVRYHSNLPCLVRSSLNLRIKISFRFWNVYGEVTTHLPSSLAHALLCSGRINGILHTTPQKFENGSFTLKGAQSRYFELFWASTKITVNEGNLEITLYKDRKTSKR